MTQWIRFAACVLFVALLGLAPAASAQLVVTISTEKEEYAIGEAMDFKITITNNSPGAIRLNFTGTPAMYMIMDRRQYVYPQFSNVLSEQEQSKLLEGHSSMSWTYRHRWEGYEIPLGEVEVVGRVNATGASPSKPIKIRVIDPTPPMKSFTVNFETVPESTALVKELAEYRAWCVDFKIIRSPTGDLKLTKRDGNNMCLAVTSAKLPTGYNIAADLTVQTSEISAEVSTKPGTIIKMIARGDEGKVLDEAVSPEFKEANTWVPLKVRSKVDREFIKTIEFWPSDASTPLQIDNLMIKVE